MRAEIETQALETDFYIKICYDNEQELISNNGLELQCYKKQTKGQFLLIFSLSAYLCIHIY